MKFVNKPYRLHIISLFFRVSVPRGGRVSLLELAPPLRSIIDIRVRNFACSHIFTSIHLGHLIESIIFAQISETKINTTPK